MVSDAQREQRRIAGRKSGKSRARRGINVQSALEELLENAPDGLKDSIDPNNVDERLAAYDKLVGNPQSWPDCLTRQKVHQAIYSTERERIQAEIEVGHLITPEQLQSALTKQADAFLTALATIPDLASEGLPAGQRAETKRNARNWIASVREHVADHI